MQRIKYELAMQLMTTKILDFRAKRIVGKSIHSRFSYLKLNIIDNIDLVTLVLFLF